MSANITRDEWLHALAEAGDDGIDDQDAITTSEFMAMMGVNRDTARRKLERLVAAGKAARTTKREHATDGRWIRCIGYRLVS